MIIRYFQNYAEKIRKTQNVARENNIPIWFLTVFDALFFSLFISWGLSIATWTFLDHWIVMYDYKSSMLTSIVDLSQNSVLIYFGIITLTIFDRLILVSVRLHSYINKRILKTVNFLDIYLWKKTGKDAVVSNMMWKFQSKFSKISAQKRRQMTLILLGLMIIFYSYRFIM